MQEAQHFDQIGVQNNYQAVKVKGLAGAVSRHWESLEESVEKAGLSLDDKFNIDKFKKTTGVQGRWLASNIHQTASDYCYCAAEALLTSKSIDRRSVGVLVYVCQTPDYRTPATACLLQERLGLPINCVAFDVNMGCSGFVYGVNIAASLLTNSNASYALLLCGDTSARRFYHGNLESRNSHSAKFLFGDAGTATLLEKTTETSAIKIASCTDGSGYKAIMNPYGQWRHPDHSSDKKMDDIAVFNFSIARAPEMINRYMSKEGKAPEDYDGLVLHQANRYILKQISKRTGFPFEKVGISIDSFGNTSSASIPITIIDMLGNETGSNTHRYLTCGFGVGLSWAAMELDIAPDDVLPLQHTDDSFDDGIND